MDFEILDKKRKLCVWLTISGIVVFIIALILIVSLPEKAEILSIILMIIGVGVFIAGRIKFVSLKKVFKTKHLKPYIEKKYPTYKYEPKQGLSREFVNSLGMYKTPDRFRSEDMLLGTFKDVKFTSSDVVLEERRVRHTKNGTQVYYVPYFTGRIFAFDFNKKIVGKVLVSEGHKTTFFNKLSKVSLESIDFNKQFNTYATDQESAFYILTPQFMEALLKIERNNPGSITMLFTEGKYYIGINSNRDTFELSLWHKVNEETVKSFIKDLTIFEEIVDELKIDRKIFN